MRLLVHVEGQTEEKFVNEVLRSHLIETGYHSVAATLGGNARQRSRRGGIRAWSSYRDDIVRHLREDSAVICTTMVDYYAMPQSGSRAWPGRASSRHATAQKAQAVEDAIAADVTAAPGISYPIRFVPFVLMHEFEGLLFSDCAAFANAIARPGLELSLQAIRSQFTTPEEINDSPITAPSKRVQSLIPGYQKPLHGTWAALEIGLARIRAECPHFNNWIERLETLAQPRS